MRSTRSRTPGRGFRGRRAKVMLAVVGGLAPLATVGTFAASAAVPTFPDNIVVFPDRDFVTVEGYQDHIDETATLKITRGDTVIGHPARRRRDDLVRR